MNIEGLTAYSRTREQAALRRYEANEKRCAHCKTVKSLDDFFRNKTELDGRGRWRKVCMAEQQREYRRQKRASGKSERERRKIKQERAAAAAKKVAA